MQKHLTLRVIHLVSDDQKGNDYKWKLQCHCIQILHSDIYSAEYSPSGMTWNLPLKKQMGWKFHGGKISRETDEIREPCPMSCQACSLTLSPFNSTHVPFLYNIKDAC